MILKRVKLHNFRNFKDKDFLFNPFFNLIIGENSKGKTNILESIFFLINGFGFRESKEVELINFEYDNNAWVEGIFSSENTQNKFKILLKSDNGFVKKTFLIENSKTVETIFAIGACCSWMLLTWVSLL